jgi:hypothetical protein
VRAAVLAGPARTEAVAALVNMTVCMLGGAGERQAQNHQQPPPAGESLFSGV